MQVCRHANIIIFIHSSRTNSEFYSRYMQIQARGQKQGHATGLHHQIQWQYEGVARGQQAKQGKAITTNSSHTRSAYYIQAVAQGAPRSHSWFHVVLTNLDNLDHIVAI